MHKDLSGDMDLIKISQVHNTKSILYTANKHSYFEDITEGSKMQL